MGDVVVTQGNATQMVCYWENGNPPAAAGLLNNRGVEVETRKDRELRHTIRDVSWHDAGLTWMCQVPRAVENKMATLTVKGENRP